LKESSDGETLMAVFDVKYLRCEIKPYLLLNH